MFFVAVIVGYPVSFETLTRGRSLGKMALGLRVVREDGGPIRFRHALVRGLVGVVEFWMTGGSVALITSLASSKGKRVGDFLAGTVVVRERMPTQAAPIAMMPPQLAGWASTLDLARVPDDLALAARQFLGRFQDLAPEVRESMGSRLAAAMAGVTSSPTATRACRPGRSSRPCSRSDVAARWRGCCRPPAISRCRRTAGTTRSRRNRHLPRRTAGSIRSRRSRSRRNSRARQPSRGPAGGGGAAPAGRQPLHATGLADRTAEGRSRRQLSSGSGRACRDRPRPRRCTRPGPWTAS